MVQCSLGLTPSRTHVLIAISVGLTRGPTQREHDSMRLGEKRKILTASACDRDRAPRAASSPTGSEKHSAWRAAALSTTSAALANLSSRGSIDITALARRIFHVTNPDLVGMTNTTMRILNNLRSKPIVCGSCADPVCYPAGVVAYVPEALNTIVVCERMFLTSATQQRRTLIHEAGHAAAVDPSFHKGPERYCDEKATGCNDPCHNLGPNLTENVDAWARFIECAASAPVR
jgi:hypothetical protein